MASTLLGSIIMFIPMSRYVLKVYMQLLFLFPFIMFVEHFS